MNPTMLTWVANLSLVLLGVVGNVMGPTMPQVIAEYGISLTTAGIVFTTQGLGRIACVFLTSSWSDRVGRKPVLRLGGILVAVGALGFSLSPVWFGQVLSVVMIGAGTGMLDASSNALVSDLHVKKRALALNRLHMFFGLGSLIGPMVAAFFLGVIGSWRLLYGFIAVLAAAHTILATRQAYPVVSGHEEGGKTELAAVRRSVLASPTFWMLGGIMLTYAGMGGVIVGWMNTYLVSEFTVSVLAASSVLTLYNVGLTMGRLVWGRVSERIGYPKTLAVCSLGGLILVAAAVLARQFWWIAGSFWATGFFLSGLFPTAVAYGTGLFARLTGTVTGYMITLSSIGGMLVPLCVGALSDAAGMGVGMLAAPFFGVIQLLLAYILWRRKPASELSPTIGA